MRHLRRGNSGRGRRFDPGDPAVTLRAHLTAAELARLAATGPLGELLARQARAHGEDHDMAALGRGHAGLPDDLVNFHYDPVACAAAFEWDGAVVRQRRLLPVFSGGVLRFGPDDAVRTTSLFAACWRASGPLDEGSWEAIADGQNHGLAAFTDRQSACDLGF